MSADYQDHTSLVLAKQPSWMLQHDLDGHRPARPDCPYCKQASLRETRAFRVPHSHRTEKSGYHLAGDFSGPHPPSVDGQTYAFIGVESTTSWGFVWLQNSRSATDTLVSLKEFVRQLFVTAGTAVQSVFSWHHDDDKSFRGPVEEYVQSQGWADTHTGGYRPNANSLVERRVGMLHQSFRTLLLRATGGNTYFEQLWGPGLTQASKIINSGAWSDRVSPDSAVAQKTVPMHPDRHPFGSYCLFKIPKELRTGKWQPSSEKGIWVGNSGDVNHGHLVVPIEWDSAACTWTLYPTVTATSIFVYDTIFPLRMGPSASSTASADFDTFVERVFEPFLVEAVELQPSVPDVPTASESPAPSGAGEDEFTVESIKKKRVKLGQVQYLVKWAGYNNRFNRWLSIDDLQCDDLIVQFEARQSEAALFAAPFTALECEAVVASQSSQLFGVDDCEAIKAVEHLMVKQNLEGAAAEFLPGYKTEIQQMLRRRLRLLGPAEATRVSREYSLGKLRMLLELKRDGRKKARLILQGFREPLEWDEGSVASPVAFASTLRMLLFTAGLRSDVISVNDVSVAFLQSDSYPEDQTPRYVSYEKYRKSVESIFQLLGPIYGQRAASREWYFTLSRWLTSDEMGFKQGSNEPCLFVNPITGLKLVIYCDDFLVRGSGPESAKFHTALESRFDCRPGSRQVLTPENPIEFTGVRISMEKGALADSYFMDQSEAIARFLTQHDMCDVRCRESPMPDAAELFSDSEPVSAEVASWCKSVIGCLHFFVRASRWDAHSVSRVSQFNCNPTMGTVKALKVIAGYLKGSIDFRVGGTRLLDVDDHFSIFTDSDHHGDKLMTSKSQTGVMVLLNGVPVHWRSNKQPKTADSPACAEIYALKEGVRDARLLLWVAEEMGVSVSWPFVVNCDSKQAISFQEDTCPKSRIRGSFDLREDWVAEVRDQKIVQMSWIHGEKNCSDIMTKCMPTWKFRRMFKLVQDFQSRIFG